MSARATRVGDGPRLNPALSCRLALRGLARAPGPTLLAIGILVLGLAAPSTFFSLLVGAIRPLPVPEGERVVRVDVAQPSARGRPLRVGGADLEALRDATTLEGLGAFRVFLGTLVDAERGAARAPFAALTPEVMPLLRVKPALGRVPGPDEAAGSVLLSSALWRETFEADPGVLGRVVSLDGVSRTVAGVLPEGFGFPFKERGWVIEDPTPADEGPWELVGRLAAGATPEAATAELGARWAALDAARDPSVAGGVLTVRGFTGGRGEGGEAVAFLGLVLVALALLVIACANVANLLLVRATERVRALSIQSALGASRGQLASQLLLESLLIAAAGGALGLVVTGWALEAVQRTLAAEHFGYFWMRMGVDGRVLVFTGALVIGAALLAGILPVLRVLRVDVQRALKEDDDGAGMGGGGAWSRAFVTLQLALSCGALVAAGLTGTALAGSGDFGRDLPGDEILVGLVELGDRGAATRTELTASLERIPAARVGTMALGVPGYGEPVTPIEVEGARYDRPSDRERTIWNAITPSYLDALDIRLLAGRGLAPGEGASGERVALVNESFVRRFAGDGEVLGRRYRMEAVDSAAWYTVVGVVSDANAAEGERVRNERVYVPVESVRGTSLMLIVRGRGAADALTADVRRAVASVDPTLPIWNLRTLSDAYAYMVRVPRAMAMMASGGGAAGLLVAAVGLYGLLAFRVRQRRRELGVRLALGADGSRLALEIVQAAFRQIAPALVIGLSVAWALSPVLSVLLLGMDPRSPAVYAGVAGSFLLTGLVAAIFPALRAAAVDPARTLRRE